MKYDNGRAEMEGQAILIRALKWYADPMHRHGDYGDKARRALARYERIMRKGEKGE